MYNKPHLQDMVSYCCGAEPVNYPGPHGTADSSSLDHNICPDCADTCDYISREDYEDICNAYDRKDPEIRYYEGYTTYLERNSD